jgi:DMSO/TMAO reductase YedYZ molybdopterin-dependent catalytic subunit
VASRSQSWRSGLAGGLLAGILAAAVSVIGRFVFGAPTFFDLAENGITRVMPPVLFAFLLDRLQFSAKPLLFLGLLVLEILAAGGFGAAYAAYLARGRPGPALARFCQGHRYGGALGYATLLWLLTEVIVFPVVGAGLFGAASLVGPGGVAISFGVAAAVFGLALAVSLAPAPGPHPRGADPGRRRLLGGLAAGASVIALGSAVRQASQPATAGASPDALAGLVLGPTLTSVPYPVPAPPSAWAIGGLTPELTPARQFYVVSKNLFGDPHLNAATWSLQIDGLVQRPLRLSYADLLRLPAMEFYQTLECISNIVGGNLMSNAWWRGVPLKDLLAMAGPSPKTVKVVGYASDGYSDSVPFAVALHPSTVVAYEMNQQPLLPEHGYPARLLLPGVYGLKNVKWLTRLQLVDVDYSGYWQQRGWSDIARVNTTSRFDVPVDHATVPAGPLTLAGVAFAGDRGIRGVQVAIDTTDHWYEATLEPPLGPNTWVRWRYVWLATPGHHALFVQAIDGTGQVQWPLPQDTVPDGATGQDVVVITVPPAS